MVELLLLEVRGLLALRVISGDDERVSEPRNKCLDELLNAEAAIG